MVPDCPPRCRCGARATHVVLDMPELEHALLFGDAPARRLVCDACLEQLLADGPIHTVEELAA